jgi:ABC-type multidrug transport system fused ATPase/permease subunit
LQVGIVGRTGSGKSSLFTSAFFRMAPLSAGRVIIDGLDIATLPLETLRQRLAIVPQDPTLFGGTIRDNLDPWAEHSDEALLHALARVQVRATHSIADRQGSAASEQEGSVIALDTPVAPGGANFSAGQAQLLALARA